jgi:hypothetical protein
MKPQDAGNHSSSVDPRRQTRSPFDVMDVPNPNDKEVLEFATGAKLAGTSDDENAKAWTPPGDRDQYGAIRRMPFQFSTAGLRAEWFRVLSQLW